MAENVKTNYKGPAWSGDLALLLIALAIDFADFLPFNVPGAAAETLFLLYLGVPPVKSLVRGITEVIPVIDLIPWCTLTVLHTRYGVSFGGLNGLLFGTPPVVEKPATATAINVR